MIHDGSRVLRLERHEDIIIHTCRERLIYWHGNEYMIVDWDSDTNCIHVYANNTTTLQLFHKKFIAQGTLMYHKFANKKIQRSDPVQ